MFFVSFIVAAAGFYYHIEEDNDEENITTEQQFNEEKEKDKPLLTPLAFGGIALVGLLGTYRKWDAETAENK